MKKRILGTVLASALVMTSLVACGSKAEQKQAPAGESKVEAAAEETKAEATGGKQHIDVIAKGFQHQFWKAVEQGSKKAAEEFGVEI